jgi:hypothetical protein
MLMECFLTLGYIAWTSAPIILALIIFFALVCYGIEVVRLFFKI